MGKKTKPKPKIGKKVVDSFFEYDKWLETKALLPRGYKVEYETEEVPYFIEANYKPDLPVTRKDKSKFYIEVKGLGRAFNYEARRKMIAVKKCNPDLDIRIVFMKDGPIQKNAKMTAVQWATKYGFPCAVGNVPPEWFE